MVLTHEISLFLRFLFLFFFPFHKNGATPLYAASHFGHIEVVKLLVSAKANLNANLRDGIIGFFLGEKPGESFDDKVNGATRQEIQRYLSKEREKRNRKNDPLQHGHSERQYKGELIHPSEKKKRIRIRITKKIEISQKQISH